MVRRCLWGSVFGAVISFSSAVQAQCTKDTDCKGDRVCDAGACKAPPAAAPEDPSGWGVGAADAADAGEPPAAGAPKPTAATPPARRPAPPVETDESEAVPMREPRGGREERPAKPKMERNSPGMIAAGIVMVSISPIPLIAGAIYSLEGTVCRNSDRAIDGSDRGRDCSHYSTAAVIYTFTSLALIGVGVPLIVIGAKRVPAKEPWQAQVVPYATPEGAGLRLRLNL